MSDEAPLRVVVAGGGIAAAEVVLALADVAGDRVAVTVVNPSDKLVMRPFRPGEAFSLHARTEYPLDELVESAGGTLVLAAVTGVDGGVGRVRLDSGEALEYDRLVLAIGSQLRNPFEQALTFRGGRAGTAFGGLLSDIEQGYTKSVAFVVPPGTTWPLPLYELALMTAREARAMGVEPELSLLTTELRPLDAFGQVGSAAVSELLAQAGVTVVTDTEVTEPEVGVFVTAGGREIDAQRVVTIPVMHGHSIPGVPADPHGFVPVDGECRVRGLANAYAAGDGSTVAIKQGGVACQQADAIAERIAAEAGADIDPAPVNLVLRGRLMTGSTLRYLSDTDPDGAEPEEPVLFAGHRKVDGRYLSPWIAGADGVHERDHDPVEDPSAPALEVEAPAS